MPQYKLIYFDLYGRAETARILFHLAGVPYEDVRYNFYTEWAEKKSESRWGVLPELEVDGKKLAQSAAINQYLAKQF
uniref:glutathione transferase n=1 Tax=Plectus sambesii TaxID=2011161 RepID=A0A914X7C7_9BILA